MCAKNRDLLSQLYDLLHEREERKADTGQGEVCVGHVRRVRKALCATEQIICA